MTETEIKALVASEVKPLKNEIVGLHKENEQLNTENKLLIEKADKADGETKLVLEKLNQVVSIADTLKNKNIKLLRETRFISDKAARSINEAKRLAQEKVNQAKLDFIENATKQLEACVGDVTSQAFQSARTIFEKEMSVVERDVLKEIARTVSPYITNPALPAQVDKLKQEVATTLKESKEIIRNLRFQNSRTQEKLVSALSLVKESKLSNVRKDLVAKLPTSIQESAKAKFDKTDNILELRKIYTSVLREAATRTPFKESVVTSKKGTTSKANLMTETTKHKANLSIDPMGYDINDPAQLELAGIK